MNAVESDAAPTVIVGGLGGSGTRLVAALLQHWGIYLGSDMNDSFDNLTYTLFFKRTAVLDLSDIFLHQDLQIFADIVAERRKMSVAEKWYVSELAKKDRPQHAAEWLQERVKHLHAREAQPDFGAPANFDQHLHLNLKRLWGWKEPNSHVLLPHYASVFPTTRYIHVVRNGLDMAFSHNQHQLHYWADCFLGKPGEISPNRSLAYWCAVQERAIREGKKMDDLFYFLNYDRLRTNPPKEIYRLLTFMQIKLPDSLFLSSCDLVKTSSGTGRFREHNLSQFDPHLIDYVAGLGFPVY